MALNVIIVLFLSLSSPSFGKIGVHRILLPISDESPFFVLKDDECSRTSWKTARPDVFILEKEEDDCSVRISPNSELIPDHRVTTSVIGAGVELIVDTLDRLEIVSRTRELLLGSAPAEELTLRGLDPQGNEFTSLRGMAFSWKATPPDKARFIRSSSSDKVLLEPVKTGSVIIEVRPVSKRHEGLSAKITLRVALDVALLPEEALILPGARIFYRVHPKDALQAPKLAIDDGSIAAGAEEPLEIKGLAPGSTIISLDVHDDEEISSRTPVADLKVRDPEYISLALDPYKENSLVIGREYNLALEIFDSRGDMFYISDNVAGEILPDEEFFEVLSSTINGTYVVVKPKKVGKTLVKGMLQGVKENGFLIPYEPPLVSELRLEIFDQITIEPKVSIFPWDPNASKSYTINYQVPNYDPSVLQWSNSNISIASIDQDGRAKTNNLAGGTTVSAYMRQAIHNKGIASIHILPVEGIRILSAPVVETEVDERLLIPVSFYSLNEDGKEVPFTDCTMLRFDHNTSDSGTIFVTENRLKGNTKSSCVTLPLKARLPGVAKLSVAYENLKDEITLAAYRPLVVVQPRSKVALLVVDSSIKIIWSGGPSFSHYQSPVYTLKVQNPEYLSWQEEDANENQIESENKEFHFRITCDSLGESDVILEVQSNSRMEKPLSSTVKVICGEPDSISLKPAVNPGFSENNLNCPISGSYGRLPALNYKNLDLNLVVLDSQERAFDNVSALQISFHISDGSLGYLKEGFVSESQLRKSRLYSKQVKTFVPKGVSGEIAITASLKVSSSIFSSRSGEIKDKVELKLVQDAAFSLSSLTILNHPKNAKNVHIKHGSGYFTFSSIDDESTPFFTHEYDTHSQIIKIFPKRIGDSVLVARDLCLLTKDAQVTVSVTGLEKVELLVTDKVMVGDTIKAKVKLYDDRNHIIMDTSFVELHPSSSIQKVVKILPPDKEDSEMMFRIIGNVVGTTDLIVKAFSSVDDVKFSSPQSVDVFPPFQIKIRNITLLVGTEFQVDIIGGPSQSKIVFSVNDDNIASADSQGLVKALSPGKTELTARVVGSDRLPGKGIVEYGRDICYVTVIPLTSIKIRAPVRQLEVGTRMPLLALHSVGNVDLLLATMIPENLFTWTLIPYGGDLSPAELFDVFNDQVGLQSLSGKNLAAIRIRALLRGTVRLKLSMNYSGRLLTDEILIDVVEPLHFVRPNHDKWHKYLLMGPDSSYKLETNKEKDTKYDIATCDVNGLLTIDKNGVVSSSSSSTGHCIIIAHVDNRILSLSVEIKPIEYIMLNARPLLSGNTLLRGSDINLFLSYHDSLGREFHSVSETDVEYKRSRHDSISISTCNNVVKAHLTKDQISILKVEGLSHSDEVPFVVRQGLVPRSLKNYFVGDIIMLDLPIELSNNSITKITTEPRECGLLLLDKYIQFTKSGNCHLNYHYSESARLIADVFVQPFVKFEFERPQSPVSDSQKYRSVALSQREQNLELTARTDLISYYPFSCEVSLIDKSDKEEENVLKAFSMYDSELQSYACGLEWMEHFSGQKADVIIKVSSSGQTWDEITLPFYPKFTTDKSLLEIESVDTPGEISITGTSDVLGEIEYRVSDYKYLELGVPYYIEGNTKKIPVYMRHPYHAKNESLKLIIHSPLTSQVVETQIHFRGGFCSTTELTWKSFFYFLLHHCQSILFILFTGFLCILATRFILQRDEKRRTSMKPPPTTNPIGSINTSSINPNGTLFSPPVNAEQKPYLWTVDNSPIYGSPTTQISPRSLTRRYVSS